MNIDLSRIIRESIDDLIYDDIISEAIDNAVLLTEKNKFKKGLKPARDARYDRELNNLRKKAEKENIKNGHIEKQMSPRTKYNLDKLRKKAERENIKNGHLTPTGPVKTDDVKELDNNSSVDGVDTHTGIVDPVTTGNPEGKGSEIPVEAPTGGKERPTTGGEPTGGESRTGGEPTGGEERPTGTDPANPEGKTDQTDKIQETAQQLFEKYNFKQYSDQLRSLIGNGIDPKPVADDQNSVQFINAFNQFLYAVIAAIESNNITRIPGFNGGKGGYGAYQNPYEESPFRTAIQAPGNVIGAAANKAEKVVSVIPGLNQLYGGVFGAFNQGREEQERLNNQIRTNYIRYQNAKNGSQGIGNTANVQGSSLSELMLGNNSMYASMNAYYQNANGTNNGKLDSIAVIPQCFEVLKQLYNALVQYQQEMQKLAQQAQQGQQGKSDEKPRPDYSGYVKLIDNQYQNVDKEANNEGLNGSVITALGVVGDLLYNVKLAIIDKLYYPEDIKDDKQGGKPLTTLMSLDDNANTYDNATYISAKGHYQGVYDYFNDSDVPESNSVKIIGNAMDVLTKLREQMKNDGVIENYKEPGGKIPENGSEQAENGTSGEKPTNGGEEQENDDSSTETRSEDYDERSGKEIMEERGKEYLPILAKQLEFCKKITDPDSIKNFFKGMARVKPGEYTLDIVNDIQIKLDQIIDALNNNVYTDSDNTTEIYNSEWVKPISDILDLDGRYGDINWFNFKERYEEALNSVNKRDKKLLSKFKNVIDTLDQLRNEMISQKMYEDEYYSNPSFSD